ncbi:phage tail protein [Deinococcus humi]|uniref:Microcystin-dependent protein n=1 Tax=Deinococcus humi TaxID=662880 RepID=A0A7W8NHA5_9DEIO|nr:tail fiber protein [Deinococcus humi]MBB5364603.1 microcystin-dependent protein [Deinococcus humi]GGO39224.1 tail Collar domain-containing protein [Deinococcus humi]
MDDQFLSEIRLMSFYYPPQGWALCNGQLLPINQNQALFALLGTMYGGNGQTNFALPDLRGRVPVHTGSGYTLGQQMGSPNVTLSMQQLPQHTHMLQASSDAAGTQADPSGALLAPVNGGYGTGGALTTLEPGTITSVGGSQAHDNMQPYLTLSYCIALVGVFPSPN